MKRWINITLWIFLFALLPACAPSITATLKPTLTPTASPYPDSGCAWQWAYKDMPEVSERWREELLKHDLPLIEEQTSAYAFGENCIGQNGEVIRFATMEVDFNVGLTMEDINAIDKRAVLVEPVLHLVTNLFSDLAPQKGFVEFRFVSPTDTQSIRISISNAEAALAAGKSGIDFYNAAASQP